MLINGFIVTISRRDTLRSLGIYCKPFAKSARDIKYHTWCSVVHCRMLRHIPHACEVDNLYSITFLIKILSI